MFGDSFGDIKLKIYELLFVLIASLPRMTNGVALPSFILLDVKPHILVNIICKHLTISVQICQTSCRMETRTLGEAAKATCRTRPPLHFLGGLLVSRI